MSGYRSTGDMVLDEKGEFFAQAKNEVAAKVLVIALNKLGPLLDPCPRCAHRTFKEAFAPFVECDGCGDLRMGPNP